ncbi:MULTISPECIES: energy transducer TonB [unclassified Lacinutrix]
MELKKNPNIEVGRNSSIYFLIGINLMLLFTWQAFEYKSYEGETRKQDFVQIEQELEEDIPITNLNTPPPPPPVEVSTPEVITVVEDTEVVEETVIESTETSQEEYMEEREVVEVKDVVVIDEIEEEIEVAFAVVENVPVFPGCTGNNNELKKCFNDKVLEHVKKTFKYPAQAQELGIQGKVYVMFIVDSRGYISNIRTRGPNSYLETEASRIIDALPKMIPGKQRNKPVNVPYSIPISFQLEQ